VGYVAKFSNVLKVGSPGFTHLKVNIGLFFLLRTGDGSAFAIASKG